MYFVVVVCALLFRFVYGVVFYDGMSHIAVLKIFFLLFSAGVRAGEYLDT